MADNLSQISIDGKSLSEAVESLGLESFDDFKTNLNNEFKSLLSKGKQSDMKKVLAHFSAKLQYYSEALKNEKAYHDELRKTINKVKTTLKNHLGKNGVIKDITKSGNAIPELNTLMVEIDKMMSRGDIKIQWGSI